MLRGFPQARLTGEPGHSRLHAAFLLLQERVSRGISNAELASTAGMSVNRFTKEFLRSYGTTPNKYLQIMRVNHAAHRLQQTDESLDSVAEEVGFCDRFHLSKAFRRIRGISPAAFRRGHRNQ